MFFNINLDFMKGRSRVVANTLLSLMFISISATLVRAQEIELAKIEVDKEITLMIPADFIPMNAQDIRNKIISYRAPKAGYTSFDRRVDMVVNVNPTPWRDQDIQLLKDFYQNNIRNLFDEVNFIQEEVKEINGRSYAVFEFISTVKGDPDSFKNRAPVHDYTWVQYTIKDQQAYVFTFHCAAGLKDQWQETAQQIMASIIFQ